MKTNSLLVLLFATIWLLGCSKDKYEESSKNTSSKHNLNEIQIDSTENFQDRKETVENVIEPDTSLTITFTNFTLNIPRLILFEQPQSLQTLDEDSIYIVPDIGETILGQKLTIKSKSENFENFKIEQRFETSVSIAADGPHCDLLNWKHYYSDWKELKEQSNNTFITETYSEKETQKFPLVSIDEFKKVVKKECGDDWYKLIESINTPNEEPSWVGISRILLRITGRNKTSGKTITKIIAIEEAMGC